MDKRFGAGQLFRLESALVVRAGIWAAVWDGDDLLRLKLRGVLVIIVAKRDAQRSAPEQKLRYPLLPRASFRLEPPTDSGGLIMINNFPVKRPAQQHDDPVAINGVPQTRRGDIIKMSGALGEPQPDRAQAIVEK